MSAPPTRLNFLPPGTHPNARRILWTRGLRAFADGFGSLLLPYYLTLLGYHAFEIGLIITATLLGSGFLTLTAGLLAHRYRQHAMLAGAALLMTFTGVAFMTATGFWPLLLIAIFGTVNPSSGDASVFGPLEQSLLTRAVNASHRTALFARYSVIGSLVGAIGAQSAAVPELLQQWLGLPSLHAVQAMFGLNGCAGAQLLRHGRGHAGRAGRSRQRNCRPAQPCRSGKSRRRRLNVINIGLWLAAGVVRRTQDHLRSAPALSISPRASSRGIASTLTAAACNRLSRSLTG